MNQINSNVIIACDFDNRQQLINFLKHFPEEKLFLKLGMELIYSIGFEIINELKSMGHQIFLDLKLHDIPHTMARTIRALNKYKVDLLTVHLSAGAAALQAITSQIMPHTMRLLGVTILTSLDDDDLQMMYAGGSVAMTVHRLARMAHDNGMFGIVCSVLDALVLKQEYPDLKLICPGIRLIHTQDDQKRVASPCTARENQADFIVVGRDITQHAEPLRIYHQILSEFN